MTEEQATALYEKQKARELLHGQSLFEQAKQAGWQDDGEGPLEFLMRKCYETGWDDRKRTAEGTR